MTIEKQLGMRIRYLRNKKKISQEELSFTSGVNRNYLSDLERGMRNPTLKVLEK
nr:helix-turn-helix domain-containing protein [Gammaproteobacteria bacterium]